MTLKTVSVMKLKIHLCSLINHILQYIQQLFQIVIKFQNIIVFTVIFSNKSCLCEQKKLPLKPLNNLNYSRLLNGSVSILNTLQTGTYMPHYKCFAHEQIKSNYF